MPEAGPEIPRVEELVGEDEEHHHNRYGRMIALATVCTTLIGALVAFAQGGSLKTHNVADARAENYGALALSAAAINRGKGQLQIDRFNLLVQQVRAADNATLFAQYGTKTKELDATVARWKAIAAATEADTAAIAKSQGIATICAPSIQKGCSTVNASYSPEQDPRFPTRYMEQGQWSAYQLTALRDAANQEADDAQAKFVRYAAALTMLAVAVFLFGYSLTPQGRPRRRLYATVASTFVVVAGLWALFQAITPVTHPSDKAARAYADGQVELNVGNYNDAITDFSLALKLRPRFIDAYFRRAQAEFLAGVPSTGSGGNTLPTTAGPSTVPSVEALNKAVEDYNRAHDEGLSSATLLFNLGRTLLLRGLLTGSNADLEKSRQFVIESISKFRQQENSKYLIVGAQLRVAEADLALARSAADQEYRTVEKALAEPDIPKEPAIGPALTDLSLIATTRTSLAGKTRAVAQQLIAAGDEGAQTATGARVTGTAPSQFGGVSIQADAGHMLWLVKQTGSYDPTKDVLSAQWSYKDPLHGEWAVLPELSGPAGAGAVQKADKGIASINPSYVSTSNPATCLPPGTYKVDLYVNNRLAGTATTKGTWQPFHAVRLRDVDGAMCVPPGYVPLPTVFAGADGYLAKDLSGGAVLFSIPKAAAASIANDQAALATVMQDAVKGFSGPGSALPALTPDTKATSTPFFMSSDNGQYQHWTYKNGSVLSGVGTSSNGQIYVGIAWGPGNANLDQDLFLSLSPL